MSLTDIVTIVGVGAALVALWNTKDFKLWRIKRKEKRLRVIDRELVLRYGHHRGSCHPITALDEKKRRLEEQIVDLKERL